MTIVGVRMEPVAASLKVCKYGAACYRLNLSCSSNALYILACVLFSTYLFAQFLHGMDGFCVPVAVSYPIECCLRIGQQLLQDLLHQDESWCRYVSERNVTL